jgi:hypothetical protein
MGLHTCQAEAVNGEYASPDGRQDPRGCEAIDEDNWTDFQYPQALWDEDEQRWISDAQIAEITFTAFEGTRWQITARLIVRRVKRLDPQAHPGQGELFTQYRYHAVFTDSPVRATPGRSCLPRPGRTGWSAPRRR